MYSISEALKLGTGEILPGFTYTGRRNFTITAPINYIPAITMYVLASGIIRFSYTDANSYNNEANYQWNEEVDTSGNLGDGWEIFIEPYYSSGSTLYGNLTFGDWHNIGSGVPLAYGQNNRKVSFSNYGSVYFHVKLRRVGEVDPEHSWDMNFNLY